MFGRDQQDRLAAEVDNIICQEWFIGDDAADLVLAGNIFVREYLYNSIQLLRFHNIDLPDLSMRNRRVEYFHIEQSFHNRNIIHIDRAACNMIGRVDITPFCSQRGYR